MSLQNFLPLRREVRNHWTYKDNDYFKLWVEILFCARFSEEPLTDVYKSQLYTLNQGEFLFSRRSWSDRLGIPERKVRTFIQLAERENMVEKVGQVGKRGASIYSVTNYKHYNNCAINRPTETGSISEIEGNVSPPTSHQRPTNVPPTSRKEERKKEKKEINTLFDSEECTAIRKAFPGTKTVNVARKKLPGLVDKYSFDQMLRTVERYKQDVENKRKTQPNLSYLNESTFWNGRFEDYLDENYKQAEQKTAYVKPKKAGEKTI